MSQFIAYLESPNFWVSVVLIAIALALTFCHKRIICHFHANKLVCQVSEKKSSKFQILYIIAKAAFWVLIIVTVLQINGVNVASLITGLGIVGIVVGFALQESLKDIFMGVTILSNNFFNVGDILKFKTVNGETITARVVSFNLMTTKLYNMSTGGKITLSNRMITEVETVSDWLDIIIPGSYDVPKSVMDEICTELAHDVNLMKDVHGCRYLGTSEFGDSSISYLMRCYVNPSNKGGKKRVIYGMIQTKFEERNLSIPYPQMDAHVDFVNSPTKPDFRIEQ